MMMLRMALNNMRSHVRKTVITVILFAIAMVISVNGLSFARSVNGMMADKKTQIDARKYFSVSLANGGLMTSLSLAQFEEMDGVTAVIPRYNINTVFVMDEDETEVGWVEIAPFDYNNKKVPGGPDLRGENQKGIILPYNPTMTDEKVDVRDYVGKTVSFECDYYKNGRAYPQTVTVPVVGFYESNEEQPARSYIHPEVFDEILSYYDRNEVGIISAFVYVDDTHDMKTIGRKIDKMGFESYFDPLAEDYEKTLKGIKTFVYITMAVIFILAALLLAQNLKAGLVRRKKEIAVLKAYGHSSSSLWMLLLSEIVICFIPSVLLAGLMCFLTKDSVAAFLDILLQGSPFEQPVSFLTLSAVATLVVSCLAVIPSFVLLKRMQPIDALRGINE